MHEIQLSPLVHMVLTDYLVGSTEQKMWNASPLNPFTNGRYDRGINHGIWSAGNDANALHKQVSSIFSINEQPDPRTLPHPS